MARVLVFGGVGELMSKIGDIELEDNVKFVQQTLTVERETVTSLGECLSWKLAVATLRLRINVWSPGPALPE